MFGLFYLFLALLLFVLLYFFIKAHLKVIFCLFVSRVSCNGYNYTIITCGVRLFANLSVHVMPDILPAPLQVCVVAKGGWLPHLPDVRAQGYSCLCVPETERCCKTDWSCIVTYILLLWTYVSYKTLIYSMCTFLLLRVYF